MMRLRDLALPVTVLAMTAPATGFGANGHLTAAFTSVHKDNSGLAWTQTGRFDWTARRGSFVQIAGSLRVELRQIGSICYLRFGKQKWQHKHTRGPTGLCTLVPVNPKTGWQTIRNVASTWKRVGLVRIDGVVTTHYRSRVDLGGLRGDGDWWIDRQGRLRRAVTRDTPEHPDSVTTYRYFEFGVPVSVSTPSS